METRHVRLGYEEALNSKKELLTMQLDFLKMVRKIGEYRSLRKKEFVLKNKLKTNLVTLRTKSQLFLSSLPNQDKKARKERVVRIPEGTSYDKELEEIREKLEKLNG